MGPGSNRQKFERQYSELLESRRRAYTCAREGTADILRQLKAGGYIEPDGSQAYKNALVAERIALKGYMEALSTFSEFVLSGKIAEEDADGQG